ncbi:MAG: tail protein X [Rhodospirillales bacterium]|nr:tail protein X [Rhodospirillales bacterium]
MSGSVMTPAEFAAAYNLTAVAGAPPVAPSAVQYVTGPADRWDIVAWRIYGDPTQVSTVIMNNPTVAISPVLPQGITLYCPLIAPPAPPANSTPWSP